MYASRTEPTSSEKYKIAWSPPIARDQKTAQFKVHVLDVDSHQLAYADSRAQKQRQNRQIPRPGMGVVVSLMLRQRLAALHQVQHARNFVDFQPEGLVFHAFWAYQPIALYLR